MGNGLRRCLACVLPCGALDLIRVVHLNGHVQEFSHPLTAAEILHAAPGHLLTKPSAHGLVRRVSILLPHSHLRRGGIYFLIPVSSLPHQYYSKFVASKNSSTSLPFNTSVAEAFPHCNHRTKSRRRDRRSRRACGGAWRPPLESINED